MKTPMKTDKHPGEIAVELYGQYVIQKNEAQAKRRAAAALRREAKAEPMKSDAFALRAQAKPLSVQAAAHGASAKKLAKEMSGKAREALEIFTARMPTEWCDWGFVKTRAYSNLLGILAAQMGRSSPKAAVVASSLNLLLTHGTWTEKTLSSLGNGKPNARALEDA